MFRAADRLRAIRAQHTCTHIEGHIHFALDAIRAIDGRNKGKLMRCLKGSSRVLDIFRAKFPLFDLEERGLAYWEKVYGNSAFRTELGALVAALTLEAQQAEEYGEECISNPAHKENLLHRLWKAKHPRSGLAGTLDEQGNILEGAEGHQALIDHWAKVFEAAATCPNAMREVLLAGVPKLEIS